jgi:hypothetical protein
MAKKKAIQTRIASGMRAFKRRLKDYPESMSWYERESLAAEAVLVAERRRKRTSTLKPKAS